MASEIIAYCGIKCNECPLYIGTQAGDDAALLKKAAEWGLDKEGKLEVADLYCDGCTAGGRLATFCPTCDVRKCGVAEGVASCGHCRRYVCDTLQETWRKFEITEKAKARLDAIKKAPPA